jgi:ribosomal protein S17E
MHPLTKIFLKIFCIFFHKNEYTIHENNQKLAENIMPNIITKNFNNNLSNAKLIVDSITKSLVAVENHHHAAGYLPFLIKSPSIDTSSLYRGLNGRSLKIIQSRLLGEDFVCLAIRRGDAPYHSKADYYFDAVDLINSMGFKVTLIGDRKYFFDLAKEKNYSFESKINNIDLTIREQKLFELFAIQNCKFIFGDQGGVWSLVSAFNRPGLMVNATPSSQLQYNVESLPRRWIYKSTGAEMLDVNKIFGELFFRWKDESKVSTLFENQSNKNIELGKDDYLINVENDKEFIIEVLERYMKDAAYLIPNKMQESVKANFPENNFLRLAENSSYSKEYINKLVGWATK